MKTSVLLSIDPSFLEETLKTAWPSILGFLYNLAFAAVIAFIGIRLIGYVKKWSRKTFLRMKVEEGVARFLSSCLSVVLYGILIFVVAGRLGVNSASIVALLGSAGIAISLALQQNGNPVPGALAVHTFHTSSDTATMSFSFPVQVSTAPAVLSVLAQGGNFLYSAVSMTIYKIGNQTS